MRFWAFQHSTYFEWEINPFVSTGYKYLVINKMITFSGLYVFWDPVMQGRREDQ